MTAADEQLVAELAEALVEARWWKEQAVTEVAAALLPVVIADRRRAVVERETEVLTRIGRLLDEWPNAASLRSAIRQVLREKHARADAVEGGGR